MDRKLRVMQDNAIFAEMTFDYTSQTSGTVHIVINRIYDLDDEGGKSSYTIYEDSVRFSHGTMSSMEEVQKHDIDLLKKQNELIPAGLVYLYEPEEYRYVVSDIKRSLVGIAEINVNYSENTKQLRFLSGRCMKEDRNGDTHVFDHNIGFMKQILSEDWFGYISDFKKLGWS